VKSPQNRIRAARAALIFSAISVEQFRVVVLVLVHARRDRPHLHPFGWIVARVAALGLYSGVRSMSAPRIE
jgi:hypothetical protein